MKSKFTVPFFLVSAAIAIAIAVLNWSFAPSVDAAKNTFSKAISASSGGLTLSKAGGAMYLIPEIQSHE